jgi:hypothetical protein
VHTLLSSQGHDVRPLHLRITVDSPLAALREKVGDESLCDDDRARFGEVGRVLQLSYPVAPVSGSGIAHGMLGHHAASFSSTRARS